MSSGGARRALITGAASGLGKSLALRFAADGWRVAVCDLDEDRIRLTAEEIDEAGGTGMSFRADVTSEEEIQHVAEWLMIRSSPLFLGQCPILNWPYMQDNGFLNVA